MSRSRVLACLAVAVLVSSCGGGGSTPSGPSTPPIPTYTVSATVFYDENANGVLDASEAVRVPNVDVVIGTGSGRSQPGSGVATVTGIEEGASTVNLRTESIPAYFQPLGAIPISVPAQTEVRIPLTLPIGTNGANVYLGYGDSITYGDGSADGQGYALKLQNLLGPHFGRAQVQKFGRPGTNSAEGLSRLAVWLRNFRPAYVLILYGTNDWQDQTCQRSSPAACFTLDSLGGMVDTARDVSTLPVLATIIPVNPAKAPEGRNLWLDDMNTRIKALAQAKQVPLADLNAEMRAAGSLSTLFADDVHPNDAGYQAIAQGWFKAISRSRSAASSSRGRFGFALP